MTGPGPYHKYTEESDSNPGLTHSTTGALPHLFLLEPSPSSRAWPQSLFLVYLATSQALGQDVGMQK